MVHGDIRAPIVMMDRPDPKTQDDACGPKPVRYHLVDFTHASIVEGDNDHLFQEDLRDLGLLIDATLGNVRGWCLLLFVSRTEGPSYPVHS